MEQSPSWEANRFSASQEIPRILCNQKVHYRIHNSHPTSRQIHFQQTNTQLDSILTEGGKWMIVMYV